MAEHMLNWHMRVAGNIILIIAIFNIWLLPESAANIILIGVCIALIYSIFEYKSKRKQLGIKDD